MLVGLVVARQLCMGLGYIYPLYASVESLRTRQEQELLQWITYWVVNACFWAVETVGDTIISWVPFYLEIKILTLAWLVLPSYRGALLLYQNYIAPAFQQHEQIIDYTIAALKRRAGEKMVQVCKDTAVIALRNSSDVVAQSQQYVATQLMQQALGKLQAAVPVEILQSGDLRHPSVVTTVTTTATVVVEDPSIADSKLESPFKRSVELKYSKKEVKGQEESLEKPNRSEKAQVLLDHFKKVLVKGYYLKYHPSTGIVKNRVLLLESVNARYLSFISASNTGSIDEKKKAARLLLYNLRRVSAFVSDENSLLQTMIEEEIDASVAFFLDNGKAIMLFEAETQKIRDLLVAGLRLLISEHKKRDKMVLKKLTSALEIMMLQQAFTKLRLNAERPLRESSN
ncbi:HVA22/DP1 gene product-related proteins [Plasmopara halstedii]|uniref:HVA22/DP1 gene product-related proteins n=1 Tax=Plasmopara halstedii TaxID=4781 RepID=A0A0P1AHD1_PLAHL|nr:HVA22/DP1 gene product-related proteins [Plasmopara halstedii]CEG40370.1 HVA22/DP1 gene product-related proteins [Plasmopara halstedii]|eukprot:XP_024576739.1 HVA22/DP1 gene product-related proteins [Plasmopara halstedii]